MISVQGRLDSDQVEDSVTFFAQKPSFNDERTAVIDRDDFHATVVSESLFSEKNHPVMSNVTTTPSVRTSLGINISRTVELANVSTEEDSVSNELTTVIDGYTSTSNDSETTISSTPPEGDPEDKAPVFGVLIIGTLILVAVVLFVKGYTVYCPRRTIEAGTNSRVNRLVEPYCAACETIRLEDLSVRLSHLRETAV